MPGAFKLEHLQPFKPILFKKFSTFFTFILGGQFLLPQRANNGEMGNLPTPKLNETEGFGCLGHSNWTIYSPLSQFCSKQFSTFSPSYWQANSYYPRGLIMGKGESPNPRIECLGHSNWTICSPLSPSWLSIFPAFPIS